MSTLAELKTRIITKLNRDDMGSGGDLETILADAISESIDFYANEQFWFNRKSGTANTVGAVATVALPTGMRIPHTVSYLQQALTKVDLSEIEYLTDTGIPTRWAENGGAIQLWPIPDGVYALSVQGIADLGVPVTTNAWTTEAAALIGAATRINLYRDVLRDDGGEAAATRAEARALAYLRAETRRRRERPLRVRDMTVQRFNINRGW